MRPQGRTVGTEPVVKAARFVAEDPRPAYRWR
jgi:hypothetical protein